MKTRQIIVAVLMLCSLLPLAVPDAFAAGANKAPMFTADLVIEVPNKTVHASLYVKGPYIRRVEMSERDGGLIYISPVDARGKIWMLDPVAKRYRILSWPEIHMDPVAAWRDAHYEMAGGFVSETKLDGHPCALYEFKYSGEDKVSEKVWQAEDLHFPIRMEADGKILMEKGAQAVALKGVFRVVNIKQQEQDDELFKVPDDFVKAK